MKTRIMKVSFLSALALTAMLATSCSNDNESSEINDGRVLFSAGTIATPNTRITTDDNGISKWQLTDHIGIYMVKKGTTTIAESAENIDYIAKSEENKATFAPLSTTIYYPVNVTSKVDFIAYYPYNSPLATSWVYPVNLSDQSKQSKLDLMYATADNSGEGYDKTRANTPIELKFKHQLVKVIINVIKGDGVDKKLSAINISGMNTTAEFDLKGENGLTSAGTPSTIQFQKITDQKKYEAILLPAIGLNDNAVTFTVDGDGDYKWMMADAANPLDLEAGKMYVYNITLTKQGVNVEGKIEDWEVQDAIDGIAQ